MGTLRVGIFVVVRCLGKRVRELPFVRSWSLRWGRRAPTYRSCAVATGVPEDGLQVARSVGGGRGFGGRSRRPLASPRRSSSETEDAVSALRREHPTWGGGRSRRVCVLWGPFPSGSEHGDGILRRRGLLDGPGAGEKRIGSGRAGLSERVVADGLQGWFPTLSGDAIR